MVHEEGRVRAVALGAARRAGLLDTARLRRGLEDHDPDVRVRALEVAAGTPAGAAVADRVIDALADPALTEVAAAVLGELDLDDAVRGRAVEALAHVATNDSDALCRESAVAALGAIGDVAGRPAILAATTDVATVRRRAVLALAAFEGHDVDEALRRALDDRDWQVRQAAEDLLAPPTERP